MNAQNAAVVGIFGQVGATVSNSMGNLKGLLPIPDGSTSLLQQLLSSQTTPSVTLDLTLDFVEDSIESLLAQASNPISQIANFLKNLFKTEQAFFQGLENQLASIIGSKTSGDRKDAVKDLLSECISFNDQLQQLIGNEIHAALSLATITRALDRKAGVNLSGVPKNVEDALMAYLFTKEGYKTIDDSSIVAPVHVSDLLSLPPDVSGDASKIQKYFSNEINQLKSQLSRSTGETYMRDSIRIVVESSYNAARSLESDYQTVDAYAKGKSPDIEKKFVSWFKGFSAMAESAAMRLVELLTHGISTFQTNPLIAAAAGTFAGTVARKLAQDAFLDLLLAEFVRSGAATSPVVPPQVPLMKAK